MKVDKIELLYLHAPDHSTDLEETMRVLNDIHRCQIMRVIFPVLDIEIWIGIWYLPGIFRA